MPRPSSPKYWPQRKQWYCQVKGRQYVLAKGPKEATRAEAFTAFHRLMADGPEEVKASRATLTAAAMILEFLAHGARGRMPATVESYLRHLQSFSLAWGNEPAEGVKPWHVTRWLDRHPWAPGTRRAAITAVKRAYSWAKKQGIIATNPLEGLERPTATRREVILDAGQVETILAAVGAEGPFRDFLTALIETGARPGEVAKVQAKDVDLQAGTWTLVGKTTRKTGRLRVVYLTPAVVEICRRLMEAHPEGPIFRNARGTPWDRHVYGQRMRRLRAKLGMGREAVSYALRHKFATDALDVGVPIATVAELLGHQDTTVVAKIYSHLSDRPEHLKTALGMIRPGDQKPEGSI